MLFNCSNNGHRHAHAADHGGSFTAAGGPKTHTIDIHRHRQSYPAGELMKADAERAGFAALSFGSELTKEVNRKQHDYIKPKMESVKTRLANMDAMGVDIQVISVSPYQYYYWAAPELGRQVAQMINDEMAEDIAQHPDRLIGLGTIPLQNTEMAITELERCVNELGFKGVEINSQVDRDDLSAPRLEPVWAKVEEMGVAVFIHTAGFTHPDRLKEHYFLNLIGHPIEASIVVGYLIFDGVMERHPGLKIVVWHGGGYLPSYAGRMDHAYHARADVREGLPHTPTHYLRRFYFDTVVFEPDQLEFLIQKYGADHILLGTDYPYDMGEEDPVGLLQKVDGLSADEFAAVRGRNAANLLNL
ncbi:MAG: aminocarboxymuconate-semialdehyde decarboxylase [Rhodospirillaceae bacterium]|nr:aminocarboxymuconate-semialdehyde decarboxylase [Rhodospirillaceae bacterium]